MKVWTVNMSEAQRRIVSKLLERVAMGEEVVIAQGGIPVANSVPEKDCSDRGFRQREGEFTVPDDFESESRS